MQDPYDGCGISSIYATSKKDPFYSACQWHDKAYTTGSIIKEKFTYNQIDKIFLHQMLEIANSNSGIKKYFLKGKAYCYYNIVLGYRTIRRLYHYFKPAE